MRMLKPLVLVVLALAKKVLKLIESAQAYVKAMTDNPRFPSPDPPLATLSAAIADVDQAQIACKTHAKGTAEERDKRVRTLKALLKRLASYVQGVADANPDDAEAIIQSAGMRARRMGVRNKPVFEVRQGEVSGAVILIARRAAPRASYEWQYGVDQKAWTTLPTTLQAKTFARDLTPLTVYYFRLRIVTKRGQGDWSQPLAFAVK